MKISLTWLGQSSFSIFSDSKIYIDPWNIADCPKFDTIQHTADIILITHDHYKNFSLHDIRLLSHANTQLIGPSSVVSQLKSGLPLRPQQAVRTKKANIIAIPAYSLVSDFHAKANEWLGYIIEIEGLRIYHTGDTGFIPEMKHLGPIDIALISMNKGHALTQKTAKKVCKTVKPKISLPWYDDTLKNQPEELEDIIESCKQNILLPEKYTPYTFPQ